MRTVHLLTLVLLLTALFTLPAVARPMQQTFDMPIYTLSCASDPGEQVVPDFVYLGIVPAGCSRLAGVEVTVADESGTVIGSCTTGADGRCFVPVTVGMTVVITENPATVPAGTVPIVRPASRQEIAPVQENFALFIHVPQQPAQPPTQLPDTGFGGGVGAFAGGSLAAGIVLLASGGYLRRRMQHPG